MTTADGHRLLFSLLANNWTTSVREVERVQDAIAIRLASMRLDGDPASRPPVARVLDLRAAVERVLHDARPLEASACRWSRRPAACSP